MAKSSPNNDNVKIILSGFIISDVYTRSDLALYRITVRDAENILAAVGRGAWRALLFAEAAVDETFQSIECFTSVFSVGFKLQAGAFGGGKHHHVHDAFAINTLFSLPYADIAPELIGNVHKLHRRAGVQAESV